MPQILIAGCGYIGESTADLFHAAGWKVEGWGRSAESAAVFAAKPYRVSAVDLSQRAEVFEHAGRFDAIVHCASSRGGNAEMYRRIYFNGAHFSWKNAGNFDTGPRIECDSGESKSARGKNGRRGPARF